MARKPGPKSAAVYAAWLMLAAITAGVGLASVVGPLIAGVAIGAGVLAARGAIAASAGRRCRTPTGKQLVGHGAVAGALVVAVFAAAAASGA